MLDHAPGRLLRIARRHGVEDGAVLAQSRIGTVTCLKPIEHTEFSLFPQSTGEGIDDRREKAIARRIDDGAVEGEVAGGILLRVLACLSH